MILSAKTRNEYTEQAAYFHQRETMYRAKAAEERAERDRRAQVDAALYQKYPRPLDTAESLYATYTVEADKAAGLAQHYGQLVTGVAKP